MMPWETEDIFAAMEVREIAARGEDLVNDIKIEKGVPLPTKKAKPFERYARVPWHELNVGDSFVWDDNPAYIKVFAKRHYDYTLQIKQVGPKSFRVWRIENPPKDFA